MHVLKFHHSKDYQIYFKHLICVVNVILTDGRIRIPLFSEIYKRGGKTRIDIALELLSKVRNNLRIKPKAVLFDSWYSSYRIMKRILECYSRWRDF